VSGLAIDLVAEDKVGQEAFTVIRNATAGCDHYATKPLLRPRAGLHDLMPVADHRIAMLFSKLDNERSYPTC